MSSPSLDWASPAPCSSAANIFVFLAYGTTSIVARQIGAGSRRGAISAGIDGLWLAVVLGVVTGALVAVFADPLCGFFGASDAAREQAVIYLRISAAGIPGMLVVLAITGVLRGLQDTRTPLVAAVMGFSANIALNVLFVYGLDMGIAGSAWGTVIAQTAMAVALVVVLIRYATRDHVPLRATQVGSWRRLARGCRCSCAPSRCAPRSC